MRSFPFSVTPFSVAPLAGGCKKMCIRRGPPSDGSAPQFGGDLTVPSGNPYRGDCSLQKIYCEAQVAGSDLSAAARPGHKLKLDGLYDCPNFECNEPAGIGRSTHSSFAGRARCRF